MNKRKVRQVTKRLLAMMLALVLSIGMMPVTALQVVAAGSVSDGDAKQTRTGGETHVLDMGELAEYVGVTFESKEYEITGNDYFTFIGEAKLQINENSQKFTDADGNVVYTSTHRFNPQGAGDKSRRSIKFTTISEAKVKVYWISGGDGREMHILDDTGAIHTETAVGSVKNTKYISEMEISAAGTYFLCANNNSNYIYRVEVTEAGNIKKPDVTTATAVQDASDTTGATVNVSFTGTAGEANSEYVVHASSDNGANWIKVGSSDGTQTSGTVTVDLSDEKLGFGTWQFRVSGDNEVVASETITYAAATYVLSGSYTTGLGNDKALLSGLTFTAKSDSIYTVPAATIDANAGTYSVVLEKGTTYEMAAVGVDEYTMLTPSGTFTYSADTTLNLEFEKKVFYPITISLGSTPDLSGKNITYTFTHEDGAEYTFTDASAITLRNGKYTVSLGGDFNEVAYEINKGDSLTVAGAAVNHAITFKPLTSWSFAAEYTQTFQGNTGYYKGLFIDATSGKLGPNGNSAQFNAGAKISVPVTGPCSVTVTAFQAQYALYTINGVAASTTNATTTYEYTGAAGTIDIISTADNGYIAGITVTYPVADVEFVAQTVMPSVTDDDTDANIDHDTDDIPRASKQDSLTVQPVGQKLTLTQIGGEVTGAYNKIANVGYYLFPMTADNNKLEFDIVIEQSGGSNGDGAFIGLFNNSYMYTLGIRKGTNPRAIYSKATEGNGDYAGAGGINNALEIGEPIHVVVAQDGDKPSVTYTRLNTGEQANVSTSVLDCDETGYYYGLIVSDATVVITNMVYTDANGTVLYDQNACYYPAGSAPTASTVSAVAAESREYIDVTWTGTVPENDGTYVVEMQRDGGAWTELTQDATGFSYQYKIPSGEGGNYKFRVCGQLGKEPLGGTRTGYATMTNTVYVLGAMEKPVVEIAATASSISLKWQVINGTEYYQVYRYSFDEGEDAATCVAERLTTNSYTDTNVEQEMPYYYQVKAVSDSANNSSPLSDTVWQVPTAGHSGDYVYEDEATEIFISKKSYDTVFTNQVVLEGSVYGDGKLEAVVNGTTVASKDMSAKDAFSFALTVQEGRNDVNLLFTDGNGNVTRETFNFVYLTNYDIMVDASYTGTDGEAVNGIPTYKTVQAAVDSVPAGNTDSKVILVLAGNYEERLVVSNPYITLVGEDRENTSIHYYPGVLGSNYEAGGDMDKRCAIYIKESAKGFNAENISFANDYVYATADGKSNKSADAIRVEADNASFVNVKFSGVQDTLYMHSGKQYYYKCLVEGLIDFIYSGEAARAFFNDCEILFVYESTKTSGYVCAPKTATDATYGLTFYNCVVTSEEGCAGTGYLLARPWGADAYITWIDCYMGKVINELAPYSDMSGNPFEDARFYEFGTYGPGFEINVDRRQISPNKASDMISADYLGWNPSSIVVAMSADHYVGSVTTNREAQYATSVRTDDKYYWGDGDDTGLKMYDMEGYSEAYGVSGGGLLKENSENYYKVASANEFLDALIASKEAGKNSVIELTADINLGCNEVENFDSYSAVIKAYSAQPLTHPTLIESGVSQLTFNNVYNLTIFSANGSSIKHANITMKNSENIIIRNIKFDELWEWDEATAGDYDRNDWDYMTIDQSCNGVWIDHCTFYKAYDGIVDVKNPSPIANVTISWCEFLPGSENNVFFDVMMDDIFANPSKYPTYQHMVEEGMNNDQVYMYAYGQKKTHLLGQSDESVNAVGIRVTLANNYYKDSMDRMPRLRYGKSHVYNCIMDAQDLLDVRMSIANEDIAKKIVSNGAASTCEAEVLLENCYINGIQNALNSGNGSSPSGYINAINSLYYMNGVATKLEPKCNTTGDTRVLVTDATAFKEALPYSDYVLYDAEDLDGIVKYYAGAGKLELTTLQWEKTSYNAEWKDPVIMETPEEKPEVKPEVDMDNDDDADEDSDNVSVEATVTTPSTTQAQTAKKPSLVIKPVTSTVKKDSIKAEIGSLAAFKITDVVAEKTGCNTTEDLEAFLKAQLVEASKNKVVFEGVEEDATSVIDITIMISEDGGKTWVEATAENFPKEGVDVVIPYPEGVDKESHDFVVGHLITMGIGNAEIGTMEYYSPMKTAEGLEIHITSASPFVVGWKAIKTEATIAPVVEPEKTVDAVVDAPVSVENASTSNGWIVWALVIVLIFVAAAAGYVVYNKKKNE